MSRIGLLIGGNKHDLAVDLLLAIDKESNRVEELLNSGGRLCAMSVKRSKRQTAMISMVAKYLKV